jgi:hypothetical protein
MVLTFIAGVARTPILFFQGAQEYNAKGPEIPPFPNQDFCSLSSVLQRLFVEPAKINQGECRLLDAGYRLLTADFPCKNSGLHRSPARMQE